jgi:acyl-homoserine-lactone acylase
VLGFTVMCSERRIEQGGYAFDHDPHGNSYLQVVAFGDEGPQAHTLLAHAQSDDPASVHHRDALERYAGRQWLRVPFEEDEIAKAPGMTVRRLVE